MITDPLIHKETYHELRSLIGKVDDFDLRQKLHNKNNNAELKTKPRSDGTAKLLAKVTVKEWCRLDIGTQNKILREIKRVR